MRLERGEEWLFEKRLARALLAIIEQFSLYSKTAVLINPTLNPIKAMVLL